SIRSLLPRSMSHTRQRRCCSLRPFALRLYDGQGRYRVLLCADHEEGPAVEVRDTGGLRNAQMADLDTDGGPVGIYRPENEEKGGPRALLSACGGAEGKGGEITLIDVAGLL